MGAQARLKARRRTELAKLSARLKAESDELYRTGQAQAAHDALTDAGVLARAAADRLPQEVRLRAAGFTRRAYSEDGCGMWDHRRARVRLIHSLSREDDGEIWGHVSVSHEDNTLPGWYQVRDAHRLFYPHRPGLIVIAPADRHVNISEVHHAWTCLTKEIIPDFRHLGSI